MTDQPNQRRVLFVEDEPALRISYERFFRPRYVMAFASSGAEALARLAEESPDVVVLDMRLPDTDGVDLLRRCRSSSPPPTSAWSRNSTSSTWRTAPT